MVYDLLDLTSGLSATDYEVELLNGKRCQLANFRGRMPAIGARFSEHTHPNFIFMEQYLGQNTFRKSKEMLKLTDYVIGELYGN